MNPDPQAGAVLPSGLALSEGIWRTMSTETWVYFRLSV